MVEIRDFFHTLPAFHAPIRWSRPNIGHNVWYGKTADLPDGEKQFEDMFTVFDIIDERDGHCMWLFCLSVCLSVCHTCGLCQLTSIILVSSYHTQR